MSQQDYFFLFATQAAAQADATVGAYWDAVDGVWRGDVCFPGVKVVTPQAVVLGISSATGFWIMISAPGGNVTFDTHASLVLKLDRDAAAVGGAFVLGTPVLTGANRTSLIFSPVPHGSRYPRPLGQ